MITRKPLYVLLIAALLFLIACSTTDNTEAGEAESTGPSDGSQNASGDVAVTPPEGLDVIDNPAGAAGESNRAGISPDENEMQTELPEVLKTMEGFAIDSIMSNERGGVYVNASGNGEINGVLNFYESEYLSWENIEPIPAPDDPFTYRSRIFERRDEVIEVTAIGMEGSSMVSVVLSYNWRTPSGMKPSGWPDDIPLMPGMRVHSGFYGERGETGLTLLGDVTIGEVAEYYTAMMQDWESAFEDGGPMIFGDRIEFNYGKDNRTLTISGYVSEDETMVVNIRLFVQ